MVYFEVVESFVFHVEAYGTVASQTNIKNASYWQYLMILAMPRV